MKEINSNMGTKFDLKPKGSALSRMKAGMISFLMLCLTICISLAMFFSGSWTSYAATVAVNPLINSNVGKHSEWYYGFGSTEPTLNTTTNGYAGWYAQLGVDTGTVSANGKTITQSERAHQLVQASSYKEGSADKIFIINSPEEAAKVWTEAVEYALGQSENSPFKVNLSGETLENGLKQTYQDQSKDPITGEVQKIPGDKIAHGNYFADPYTVEDVNGQSDQISYKGQYITVKLNCDWYAKDIETNIAFALGNEEMTPSEQVKSGKVTHDMRWITTFNWAKDQKTFEGYWLDETNNWGDKDITRKDIRDGYSQSMQVTRVPGENGTVSNRQLTTFYTDGHGYTNADGYYASYDLATMADQTANAEGQVGFNISSPFSYGRINVPTGAYIVLDLNGHTISRGLTEENNEEISYHGSILKSKYEYDLGEMDELNQLVTIYDGKTLGDIDGGNLYGNELCYYGSVMTVQPKARLEIMDSSAYERASDGRITAQEKTYTTNHKGTVTGGCTDDKYYVYMDNDAAIENGATFGYNTNEGKGGAVHVNASGELVVHSGTFKDNQAVYGGAFYALSRAAVLVYNGYFINNYATMHGGATYVASASRSVFTFYDGVISYNRAAQSGGGVFLRDRAYVNLHGGYITYNQAGYQGGGAYIGDGGEGLLENVNITHNVSGHEGGGIYVYGNSKFEFAGSLIVTQNYGNCGTFNTREVGPDGDNSDTTFRTPYILRLKFDGKYLVACGTGSQSRYNWTQNVGEKLELKSGYTRTTELPSPACSHNPKHTSEYPMWSMGDAFSKEYNGIGGVVWKNKEAKGDVTKIATAADVKASNVYLSHCTKKVEGKETTYYAKIIIAGKLFRNGIGAQIGVTMEEGNTGDFTLHYKEIESTVDPRLYFTSDDTTKSVVWNETSSEAMLGSEATTSTVLTWEITGYLYGQTDKTITITATGDGETSFVWNTHSPSYHPEGVTELTKGIDSFKWTGKTMLFDHKMFEVTRVVAKEAGVTWNIGDLTTHLQGKDYSFHYLLAAQGDENEATGGRLVYAGDYSFRVTTGNYSNATFTIHINQLGVAVSAYEVKDGKTTWSGKENIFEGGKIPEEHEITSYLQGALYYRGTPYDFVLDKAYREDTDGEYTRFTGAVMKFTYANKDFFGTGVEIDFGKVDFALEYYWRELGDSSQQELEKTNYFLHAGFYEVRGAHEVTAEGAVAPAVDYMKNNITFESEMHLPIQRVSVSVWLEDNACVKNEGAEGYFGYTFKNAIYTTKQILYFNNNDEAGNDPELDPNVVVQYYRFDDYILKGDKADPVGIMDNVEGTERYGVKDAGKYVVHVSLNTKMWIEGDEGKDDFTERGKPYNDYIFTSRETQRMAEKKTEDEQGRQVSYEFAYYFFIQPAVITSWENNTDPTEKGAGYLSLADRIYDATDTEPTLSGKMRSATEDNAFYPFDPFAGDTPNVYVRYLKKTAENTDNLGKADEALKEAYKFTYDQVKQYGAKSAEELKNLTGGGAEAAIAKWFQDVTKFKPTDAGDYWILVWFRGVSPVKGNDGSTGEAESYIPVTNFKGVYIGTYTIKPVEITVTGSLSYTYDGSNFERARYLPPREDRGDEDAWYESIFFLVQDNNTTPNDLIEHQHESGYQKLDDLWGGYDSKFDPQRYMSRFTLSNPTVSYSDESFKEHGISLGIGLYSFKTEKADQGTYHLTTVGYDNVKEEDGEGGTLTAPTTEAGVTWLITYGETDAPTKDQTQAFNTSQNFVIDTTSWLDVTINRKDISDLHDGVTKIGAKEYDHWTSETKEKGTMSADGNTGIVYPFAGSNFSYRPAVDITYTPSYVDGSGKRTAYKKKVGGADVNADLKLELSKDISVNYLGNNTVGTATIRIEGQGNYTGALELKFDIRAARIAAIKKAETTLPVYDMNTHAVQIEYENVENYDAYLSGILYKSATEQATSGDFTAPVPGLSSLAVYYAKRETQNGQVLDKDQYGVDAPVDAGVYGVLVQLGDRSFTFDLTSSEDAQKPTVTAGEALECGLTFFALAPEFDANKADMPYYAHGTHTVLPATVSVMVSGEYVYNGTPQQATLVFENKRNANVVPVADDYKLSCDTVEAGSFPTNAGTYVLNIDFTGKNENYAFTVAETDIGGDAKVKVKGYNATFNTTQKFMILRAALNVKLAATSAYFNREVNEATVQISNVQPANGAVPTIETEYTVTYTISEASKLLEGKPYAAGEYTVTVTLTDAGAKNYVFEVATGDHPFEGVADSKVSDKIYYRSSMDAYKSMTNTWTINKLQVSASQSYTSNVYDRTGHFFFGKGGAWGIEFTTTQISGSLDGLGYVLSYTADDGAYVVMAQETKEAHTADDFSVTKDGGPVEASTVKALFEKAQRYTFTLTLGENYTLISNFNLTYEITRSILNVDLYEGTETGKPANRSIGYDGAIHKLYPILTSSNGGAGLLTDGGDYKYDVSELTVGYTYAGWNNTASTSPNYIDVGAYSVALTLNSNNFAFDASGTKATTLTYNISALNLANLDAEKVKAIVKLAEGYTLTGESGAYTITLESGDIIYTGYEITPVAALLGYLHDSVSGGEGGEMTEELVRDASYTLAYSNNTDKGTATVRITGAQNYLGIIEIKFTILPKSLGTSERVEDNEYESKNDSEITESNFPSYAAKNTLVYRGTAFNIQPLLSYNPASTSGSRTLSEGTHYTNTYYYKQGDAWVEASTVGNILHAGTYRAFIAAKKDSNYTGAYIVEFTVSPSKLHVSNTLYNKETNFRQTYNGQDLTPPVLTFTSASTAGIPSAGEYEAEYFSKGWKTSDADGDYASAKPQNAGAYYLSITLNTDDDFTDFVWDDAAGSWFTARVRDAESAFDLGMARKSDTELRIYFLIRKATVTVEEIPSTVFDPLAANGQKPQITFRNADSTALPKNSAGGYGYTVSFVPTDGADTLVTTDEAQDAPFTAGLPYHAGEYTVTITLTGEDDSNFAFAAGENTKTFTITPLEVGVTQAHTGNVYDNKDHFRFDQTMFGEIPAEGDESFGAWQVILNPSTGTSDAGISYNFRYTADDGTTYLVKYEYSADTKTVTWFTVTDGRETELHEIEIPTDLFTNVKMAGDAVQAYEFTIEFSSDYTVTTGSHKETETQQTLQYTITPALLSVNSFANKTFANETLGVTINETTFVASNSTLTSEEVYDLLKATAGDHAGSLKYFQDGKEVAEPFNAGTYTVQITINNPNFAFNFEGSKYNSTDESQTFTIDPFDISTAEDFSAILATQTYTGVGVPTTIVSVSIKFSASGEIITFGQGTDNEAAYNLYHTNAGGYLFTTEGDNGHIYISGYTNNVNAGGSANAILTGTANFKGTREVTFTIDPARVIVSASDGDGDAGSLTFVYNRTSHEVSFTFTRVDTAYSAIAVSGLPTREDYVVEYYTKYSIDGSDNSTATLLNAGSYYAVIRLTSGNFRFADVENSRYTPNGTLNKTAQEQDWTVSFPVTITAAQITVHLADDFNGTSSLNSHFPYNKSNYATALKSVSFAGSTTPNSSEYQALFKSVAGDTETDTENVTNAGDYKLVFELINDGAKNFVIQAIEAGSYTLKESDYAKIKDTPFTSFSVAFTIDKAQLEVYLATAFKSGSAFNNKFDYNKSAWARQLSFVDLENGANIIPATTAYEVKILSGTETSEALNAGSYKLTFKLIGGGLDNYIITAVYAGTSDNKVSLTVSTDYTITEGEEGLFTAFEVGFTIEKAQLKVYLPEAFKDTAGGAAKFAKAFEYNKSSWWSVLGSVTFENVKDAVKDILPVGADYNLTLEVLENGDSTATNAGRYKLNFRFTDDAAVNYVITAVYAGTGTGALALDEGDYTNTSGSEKPFTAFEVEFEVTKAQIIFFVSPSFLSDGEFSQSKEYDGADWYVKMTSYTWINENGGVVPEDSAVTLVLYEYHRKVNPETNKLLDEYEWVTRGNGEVIDVGLYAVGFTLSEDALKNFTLKAVYAGSASLGTGRSVQLEKGEITSSVEGSNARKLTEGKHYNDKLKAGTEDASVAVAFEITPATIDVHFSNLFVNEKGAFNSTFTYDGGDWTQKLGSVTLSNTTEGNSAVPGNNEYTIEFYQAINGDGGEKTDWDPNPIDSVKNVGIYTVTFRLKAELTAKQQNKIWKNFTVAKAHAGDTLDIASNVRRGSGEDDVYVTIVFTITKAQLKVYLADAFKGTSGFVKEFDYNKTPWATALNVVRFVNDVNTAVPTGSEYTVSITSTTGDDNTALNAGGYKLSFTLSDDAAKNFVVTAVYAGEGDSALLLAKDTNYTIPDGKTVADGFTAFEVGFTIKKAQLEVYLAEGFIKTDGDDKSFTNMFDFNKTAWATTIGAIEFYNQAGNSVIPVVGDYTLKFLDSANMDSTAYDAGNYKFVFEIDDPNYVIVAVYAGVRGTENCISVPNAAEEEVDAGYVQTSKDSFTAFEISFTVKQAEIEVYLAEQFYQAAPESAGTFKNSFVFDGTDWGQRLKLVGLQNVLRNGVIPTDDMYSVTFGNTGNTADTTGQVIDVGDYKLIFALGESAKNYKLAGKVYAGSASGANVALGSETDYTTVDENSFSVSLKITPASIDVYFSATQFKTAEKTFANSFYYDRNDWKDRLGVVTINPAVTGEGTVPAGSQYSIEFYSGGNFLESGTEDWTSSTRPIEKAITDIGRYSITFRLSNADTGTNSGKKHYENYKICDVYAGGSKIGDAAKLEQLSAEDVTAYKTNGYRVSSTAANNVYVTLVFDIKPVVVELTNSDNKVFNNEAQDAGFQFRTVEGDILPIADTDYTTKYDVGSEKIGNERFDKATGKPYFAGHYKFTITLKDNFVFAADDEHAEKNRERAGEFSITAAVLSGYLAESEESKEHAPASVTYDGKAHEYAFGIDMAVSVDRHDAADGATANANIFTELLQQYNGWAGTELDDSGKDTSGNTLFTNAGTYTFTMNLYRLKEDNTSSGIAGGNFCFGDGIYSLTLTYSILQRDITGATLNGIQKDDELPYNGQPQTNILGVSIDLTPDDGADELTTLILYDNAKNLGDYSVTHSADINVGTVTANILGMHNFQGSIDITYKIVPAIVSVTVNEDASGYYNRREQGRSFTFENILEANKTVLPNFNTTAAYSDYTIAYYTSDMWDSATNALKADAKALGGAPADAGEYFVLVTLKSSTGNAYAQPNFNFKTEEGNSDITATVARFAFTIKKAEIYVQDIPSAVYSGANNPAQIVFVNRNDRDIVPTSYTVTYTFGEDTYDAEGPTNVMMVEGEAVPYRVLIKLFNETAEGRETKDADNFIFVAYGGTSDGNYEVAEDGLGAKQDYLIVPASVSGTLSITIGEVQQMNVLENLYTTTPHVPTVSFSNPVSGAAANKPADGKLTAEAGESGGDKYTYIFTFAGYTISVQYTPGYTDEEAPFNGLPCDAGTYYLTVNFTTNNFRFGDGADTASWTYIVRNREISTSESGQIPANAERPDELKAWERGYDPSAPVEFLLDALKDFVFTDTVDHVNAERAKITYLSCSFAPEEGSSYSGNGYELGETGGYLLGHAGTYTVRFQISAPNHNTREFTLQIAVKGVSVELLVIGTDAEVARYITSIYGSELSSEQITEAFYQLILDGKVTVTNVPGEDGAVADKAQYQVDWLKTYHFLLTVDARRTSNAGQLRAGSYKLTVSVGGYDSGIVFVDNALKDKTSFNPIYTVDQRAVVVDWTRLAEPIYYTGADLTDLAFSRIGIKNLLERDIVQITGKEGGIKEALNGIFTKADVIDVGDYVLRVYGLDGEDSSNYVFSEAANGEDTDEQAEYRDTSAYHPFAISRRPVEILLAASQSVYGDQAAIYGEPSEKAFRYTFSDDVLTDSTDLHEFIMNLLALWRTHGDETAELDKETVPYPYAATEKNGYAYFAMLSAASKDLECAVEGSPRHFVFDHNYELYFAENAQGAHTITPRSVTIRLNDSLMYYGESLEEAKASLSWTASALDATTGFVTDTDEEAFSKALTLQTDIKELTPHVSDATHAYKVIVEAQDMETYPDIFASYNITFVEGTFTVMPRPVRIVIHSVTVIYGEQKWSDLNNSHWMVSTSIGPDNMGKAGTDTNDALNISLRYSMDRGFGNVNVKLEEGKPAPYHGYILGECGNENYAATFVNDGETYVGGGDVIVEPRSVDITIEAKSGTYGDAGLTYGALLSSELGVDWNYTEGTDKTILERDLGYLKFYLDGTPDSYSDPAQLALFVQAGDRNIVGTWAYGIADDTPGNNYIIHFYGDIGDEGQFGLIRIAKANVTQEASTDWRASAAFRSDADHEDEYSEQFGWYSLAIDETMFTLRGDYGLGGHAPVYKDVERDEDGNITAIIYTIEIDIPVLGHRIVELIYHKPTFSLANGQEMTDEERADMRDPAPVQDKDGAYLWYVHTVGVWTMAVEIKADDHNVGKFDYSMNIVSVQLFVTLDVNVAALSMVYAEDMAYAAYTAGWTNFNDRYETEVANFALTQKLNEYILSGASIITSVYGTGFEEAYGNMDYRVFVADYIAKYCHIEVVSPKVSAGGFLNAGLYDLQIVAEEGCGFSVQFYESATSGTPGDIGFGGRNRLYVAPRVLEIDWVDEDELEKPENLKEDDTQITYTYSGYQFTQTPRFTNILASGDVSDAVDMPKLGTNFNFLNSAGEQVDHIRDVDSYTLKLLYNGDSVRLRGDDAGNYVLPEVIEKPFIVNPMKLSVTIHDQTSVYGDQIGELTWKPDGELGHDDDLAELNIKLKCYTADGSSELKHSKEEGAVGSYKIVGTWENNNYDITFVGSWKGEGEHQGHAGTYTVTKRDITVKIGDARSIYGNEDADLGFERNIEGLAYNDKDDDVGIKLSRKEGKNAGLYPIYGEADNTNYNVTFTGSWAGEEDAGRAGTYTVEQRDIHITLNDVTRTYGEWLDDDAHKAELDLEYTVDADYRLVDGDKLVFHHDKEKGINVGTYTLTASEEDDEDGNYNITVTNSGEAKLTITKRPIDIVIEDSESVYGDALKADTDFKWHIDEGEGHLGLAAWDKNDDLNVALTLEGRSTVARADVGKYFAIKGAYTNGNYDVTFHDAAWSQKAGGAYENNGAYSITKRPIKVTIRNAGSIYGTYLDNEFDASLQGGFDVTGTLAFAGTPDEHTPDDLRITLTKRSGRNVGEYEITGTSANKNYEIEWVNGIYTISKRPVTVIIHDQSCVYGQYGASDFLSLLLGTDKYHLKEGDKLAYNEGLADLAIILSKAAGIDAGDYDITGISLNGNYDVTFEKGVYTIKKAINEWEREFRLKQMNEGDTPAEEDIRPIAKFAAAGEPVVKYYLDEACTEEYTADLSEAQAGTYYVVVTVADCNNWSKLEKSYSFVVNPSFAVVNNNLELWPYIVLWSSQIVALTLALIFIRKKRKKRNSEIK